MQISESRCRRAWTAGGVRRVRVCRPIAPPIGRPLEWAASGVRWLRMAGFGFALFALTGCGHQKPRDVTPTPQIAENAVRRGLDAWKEGQPVGEVPGNPMVFVTDGGRKPNQTLESYEIDGETKGSTGRTIAVTLHMANPVEEIKTRYVVLGIDPLWVWRQEDYELLMHWEHRMPPKNQPAQDVKSQQSADENVSAERLASEIQADEQPADAEMIANPE